METAYYRGDKYILYIYIVCLSYIKNHKSLTSLPIKLENLNTLYLDHKYNPNNVKISLLEVKLTSKQKK